MSITKGAMLISNANAVGAELVNKLGGTGYKPVEWADAINLLGINSVDAPYAIKSIQAGTYTGDERGAIRYSNCNAVGSMLNKKLNTNRGFKPVEWPSAIKVLKALAENTVTGDICNVSDGADRVPLKSWSVNIPVNLSGKSTVVCNQGGKNFADGNMSQDGANRVILINNVYLVSSTYTISLVIDTPRNFYYKKHNAGSWTNLGGYNKSVVTFSISENDYYDFSYYVSTGVSLDEISNLQLEYGSTATTYTQYVAPTVNTVDLGRTVYGADVDVVGGTCEPINWLPNVASSKTQSGIIWTVNDDGTVTLEGTSTARTYLYLHTYFKILPFDATITVNVEGLYDNGTSDVFVNIPYSDNGTTYSGSYGQITWANPTKQINYTADKYIGFYIDCPAGTTTNQTVKITVSIGTTVHTYSPYFEPFTFDPITTTPETNTSVNFWNDTGSNTITYYQAPTALTRSTVSGSIASFSDADTRLTCVNAIATIPPSISGVDTVQLVDAGKNLLNPSELVVGSINSSGDNINSTTRVRSGYIKINGGQKYAVSIGGSVQIFEIHQYKSDFTKAVNLISVNAQSYVLTASDDTAFIRLLMRFSNNATIDVSDITELQVQTGDTVTAYEAYNATTYTANLPSTNYGGSVDFVNGDETKTHATVDMGSLTWQYDSANTRFFTVDLTSVIKRGTSGWITDLAVDPTYTVASGTANDKTISEYATTGYVYIKDTDYTDPTLFKTSLNGKYLTYPLATPTTASITGQAIIPKTGTNNCYNNVGGNTEITYFTNT